MPLRRRIRIPRGEDYLLPKLHRRQIQGKKRDFSAGKNENKSRRLIMLTRIAAAPAPVPTSDSNMESQPPMMSLKAFINTLDDNVSDEEALKKYNEYKQEFRRQQLNEFFVAHKDEEWSE